MSQALHHPPTSVWVGRVVHSREWTYGEKLMTWHIYVLPSHERGRPLLGFVLCVGLANVSASMVFVVVCVVVVVVVLLVVQVVVGCARDCRLPSVNSCVRVGLEEVI